MQSITVIFQDYFNGTKNDQPIYCFTEKNNIFYIYKNDDWREIQKEQSDILDIKKLNTETIPQLDNKRKDNKGQTHKFKGKNSMSTLPKIICVY